MTTKNDNDLTPTPINTDPKGGGNGGNNGKGGGKVKGGDIAAIVQQKKALQGANQAIIDAQAKADWIAARVALYEQACLNAAVAGATSYDYNHDFDVSEVGGDGAASIRAQLVTDGYTVTPIGGSLFRLTWPQ